jgi:acyl carrier protein
VKIRGFRIEPGEIEAMLTDHASIREAVVIDREDTPGHRRLVAYVTPRNGTEIRTRDLRKAVREKLPQYMVPSAFVTLDELPLTAHGKIDRAALPAPSASRLELERSHTPARNVVEEVLVNIWQQVLGVARIGIHDSFFDIGGHSLLAMQLVSRIREDFGIDLPLPAVFSSPTIAALSQTMSQDPGVEHAAKLILATAHLSDDELEALVAAA